MKTFSSFTIVKQPIDVVWVAMRDNLYDVGKRMDDLHSIETLERERSPEGVRLLNRWVARQKIPPLLRRHVGSEQIEWLDSAFWRDADKVCLWSIRSDVFSDYVECTGTTRYQPAMAGRGTRVSFDGHFVLKPGFSVALPAALEPAVTALVESMASTLIPRNLARAVQLAADSQPRARHEPAARDGFNACDEWHTETEGPSPS